METIESNIEEEILRLPKDFIEKLSKTNLLLLYIQRFIIQSFVKEKILGEDQIQELNDKFCKLNNINDTKSLLNYLKGQGMSYEDHITSLKSSFFINSISEDKFSNKAEAHFLKRKDDLDRYTYSLIRVQNSDLIHELFLQVEEGEKELHELSQNYSEGPERNTSGRIGPVSINSTHPMLREKLRAIEKGQLIAPFKIDKWWIIVRLEDKIEASYNREMKTKMCLELFDFSIKEMSKDISYKLIESLTNL